MRIGHRPVTRLSWMAIAVSAMSVLSTGLTACHSQQETPAPPPHTGPPGVTLSPAQLRLVTLGTVGQRDFTPGVSATGMIDFDEDHTVQVFTPYQGRIVTALVQLGDNVRKGQPLFTVESPDLITAASTLAAAEAAQVANAQALERARKLHASQGMSDQMYEQAIAAEATSRAAAQAARQAMAVFGRTPAEVQTMAAHGRIESLLVVRSPVSGQVTARNAQPGLLIQPGNAPAPYVVGDTSHMWMVANAAESDAGRFHVGQRVEVTVAALPGRSFVGRIATMGASVDPTTHTVQLRATVENPGHLLLANMLADFHILTSPAISGASVPAAAIVREGDGTMTAWTTTDHRHFTQTVVNVGAHEGDMVQILSGLHPGQQIVTNGAIYLDNMLSATPDD